MLPKQLGFFSIFVCCPNGFQRIATWESSALPSALQVTSLNCTREFHIRRKECIHYGNNPTKHGKVVTSIATRVEFGRDGHGKFGRVKYVYENYYDNQYIIHTHDAWPSQMHSNLLISGVETLAIARALTLLINNFHAFVRANHDGSVYPGLIMSTLNNELK